MNKLREDFDVQRSRAVEPIFYRAPTPGVTCFGKRPMEFQFAGVEYVLNRNNALIGDEPGLTKTAQGIMISNALEAKRTLCVVPASLRLNWEREIHEWSTIPNVTTYPILKAKNGVSLQHNYVIISYDLLRNEGILDALMDQRWDHLILDEAHMIKDPKGNKRTRVICAPDCLPAVVGRITMLSGTILPNEPRECYNACRLLNWNSIDCASLEDFNQTYYAEGEGWTNVYDKAQGKWIRKWSNRVRNVPINLDDLQYRLRKHIMVRRLKPQVLHELPPKRWHLFPLQRTAEINTALKHPGWREAERLYELNPEAFQHQVAVDGDVSTARRLLGEAKVPEIADYIEELLAEGVEKVVVGGWHLSVLAALRSTLEPHGIVYMDGSTSPAKKQWAVDQFQTNPKVKIILGQILPLGEGWTLTAAQDCVLAEPYWVPGKNDQFFDRINRMGQKGAHTICHVPVVPGTLDEKVLGTAIEKDRNIYAALDKH